jgi:hypothetical protein
MDTQILHGFDLSVPGSVRALDALLNRRVAEAQTPHEVDRWMRAKVRYKRRLVSLPDALIRGEAETILRELTGRDGGRGAGDEPLSHQSAARS